MSKQKDAPAKAPKTRRTPPSKVKAPKREVRSVKDLFKAGSDYKAGLASLPHARYVESLGQSEPGGVKKSIETLTAVYEHVVEAHNDYLASDRPDKALVKKHLSSIKPPPVIPG